MGLQQRFAPCVAPLPRIVDVLIVEDQPLVAATARDMVETIGGGVVAIARTVEEALASCDADAFDVALLDIDLGGASSAPVAAALDEADRPFLIVTGSDELPPGFGGRAFLVKPYTLRALRDALAGMLA